LTSFILSPPADPFELSELPDAKVVTLAAFFRFFGLQVPAVAVGACVAKYPPPAVPPPVSETWPPIPFGGVLGVRGVLALDVLGLIMIISGL